MAILFFEGFETSGDEIGLANEAIVSPNIRSRWSDFDSDDGGDPTLNGVFLIDDFLSEGYALNMGIANLSQDNFFEWQPPSELQVPEGPAAPTFIVGFRFWPRSVSSTYRFLQIYGVETSGNLPQLGFDVLTGTDLRIQLGSLGYIDTVSNAFTMGAWHYVEIRFKNASSGDGGLVQVWVDNILISDNDPVSATQSGAVAATSAISWSGHKASATAGDYTAYDDFYIVHEDVAPHQSRLGSVRVVSLPPTSDFVSEWTESTEMVLATTLDGPTETSVVVGTGEIPSGAAATGTLRVERDDGGFTEIAYTAHNSDDTFTTASTSWSSPADATLGNIVRITINSNQNYTAIDENGVDYTDYSESDRHDKRDLYNLTDLVDSGGIWAVKIEAEARNETGGEPCIGIQLISGTTTDQTDFVVDDTTAYNVFDVYYQQDPDTGATWTNAAVDALLAGFKLDNKVS